MPRKKETDLLRDELALKTAELTNIKQAGILITSSLDIERILALLMELGLTTVGAEVGAILLQHNGQVTAAVNWGIEGEILQRIRLADGRKLYDAVLGSGEAFLSCDTAVDGRLERIDEFAFVRTLLFVPLQTQNKIVGLMAVVNKQQEGETFTDADLDMLTSLSGFASVAIENARLHIEEIQKQKMEQELKLASHIQMGLLPCAPPEIPGATMKGMCFPAKDVGGDYYDYLDLGDGKWGILIADVSSKGAPAALLMAMVRIVFRVVAAESHSPAWIIRRVNSIVHDDISGSAGMFVTLFLGVLDTRDMSITYTNAGHCPTVVARCDESTGGKVELIELKTDDIFLGFDRDWEFHENRIELHCGDLVAFYTDGVTDVLNKKEEVFGAARFYEALRENRDKNLTDLSQYIFNSVMSFSGEGSTEPNQYDDFTLVLLRYL